MVVLYTREHHQFNCRFYDRTWGAVPTFFLPFSHTHYCEGPQWHFTMPSFFSYIVVLPSTWEVQPVDASGKASTVHMVDVLQGSTEYQETLQNFHATNNQTLIVTSLKRVQNPTLYQKHTTLQDTICKKYSKKVDVRHLFHGSDVDSIRFIATQGFNRMLASDANGMQS